MEQLTKPVIEWEPTAEELDNVIDMGLEEDGEVSPSQGLNTEVTSTEAEEENPSEEELGIVI